MLYRFTVYLGSDHTIARKKITDTKGNQIVSLATAEIRQC
jgi:hypothetical protein